ncbi:MAG: hypothetical protein AB9895_00140 [Negativicutes bacterium]
MTLNRFDSLVVLQLKRVYLFMSLTWRIIRSPQRTIQLLCRLKEHKTYLATYFTANVAIVTIISVLTKNTKMPKEIDKIVIKIPGIESISLEVLFSFVSYFFGVVIFATSTRYFFKKIKINISMTKMLKILFSASAVFIPIMLIDGIANYLMTFFFDGMFNSAIMMNDHTAEDKVNYVILVTFVFILMNLIYAKFWWGYIVISGLNIKIKKAKGIVAFLIIIICLYNFLVGIAPLVPQFKSLISLADKIETYSEMVESRDINIEKAQLITGTLALDDRLPLRLRYIYGLHSLAYHLYVLNPEQEVTSTMIYFAIINDTDKLVSYMTEYIGNMKKIQTRPEVIAIYQEIFDKIKDLQKYKDDPSYHEGEREAKFGISKDFKSSPWGRIISLTP